MDGFLLSHLRDFELDRARRACGKPRQEFPRFRHKKWAERSASVSRPHTLVHSKIAAVRLDSHKKVTARDRESATQPSNAPTSMWKEQLRGKDPTFWAHPRRAGVRGLIELRKTEAEGAVNSVAEM
jgi:hypothetical protein